MCNDLHSLVIDCLKVILSQNNKINDVYKNARYTLFGDLIFDINIPNNKQGIVKIEGFTIHKNTAVKDLCALMKELRACGMVNRRGFTLHRNGSICTAIVIPDYHGSCHQIPRAIAISDTVCEALKLYMSESTS